jgi:hypothetical protein
MVIQIEIGDNGEIIAIQNRDAAYRKLQDDRKVLEALRTKLINIPQANPFFLQYDGIEKEISAIDQMLEFLDGNKPNK